MRADGRFAVEMVPEEAGDADVAGLFGLSKRFEGGLEATSRGRVLTALTDVPGSRGYVAVERITGRLAGRDGSFTVLHFGLMGDGEMTSMVRIVPDSGDGELASIRGEMHLNVDESGHTYSMDFELEGA